MRHTGRLDDLHLLGPPHICTEIVEETRPTPEEDRDEREQELVQVPGRQILLGG